MQIGRRIYYELSTGNIIVDTGERQGSVYVTLPSEDFVNHSTLSGRSLADTDYLELDFGVRSAEFINIGSYHVDIPTKTLVIYPHQTSVQNKTQIIGNGVDKLTITVTTSNDVADTINFTVNGVTQAIPTDANGQAVFQLVSSVPGDYTISITSTKHGNSSANVKVV